MSNFADSPDIGDSPERSGIPSGTHLSTTIDNEETALSKYEHELERMTNESLVNGQDLYAQKLFIAFQNAAKAVTKMFRGKFIHKYKNFEIFFPILFLERSNGTANWNTFHAAAGSVTMLYKGKMINCILIIFTLVFFVLIESLDALKDAVQLGIINGEQRKTKELLCWARRKTTTTYTYRRSL